MLFKRKKDCMVLDSNVTFTKKKKKHLLTNIKHEVWIISQIRLKGQEYYVSEVKQRYLWLATRMDMPTIKDRRLYSLKSIAPWPYYGDDD